MLRARRAPVTLANGELVAPRNGELVAPRNGELVAPRSPAEF